MAALVRMLRSCPDVVAWRKEVLVATRYVMTVMLRAGARCAARCTRRMLFIVHSIRVLLLRALFALATFRQHFVLLRPAAPCVILNHRAWPRHAHGEMDGTLLRAWHQGRL